MILIEGYRPLGVLERRGTRPCRLFHRWTVALSTGVHRYEACAKCATRRIIRTVAGGYQPVDRGWLETGQFESFQASRMPVGGTAARGTR